MLADDGDSLIRASPLKSNDVLKKCWAWLIIICISTLDFDMKFPRWGYYRVEGLGGGDFFASAEANTLMKAGLSPGSQISVFGGSLGSLGSLRRLRRIGRCGAILDCDDSLRETIHGGGCSPGIIPWRGNYMV